MWFSKMVLERSNCLKSLAAHKIFLQGDGKGGSCFWHDFNDSTSRKKVCYSIHLLPSPIAQRQSTRLLIEGLLVRIQLGERFGPVQMDGAFSFPGVLQVTSFVAMLGERPHRNVMMYVL